MARKEVLTPWQGKNSGGFWESEDHHRQDPRAERRADTPMQALMEAAPGEEPEPSIAELIGLRDVLADAMDQLTEEEREIVNATVIEQASLRELDYRWGGAHARGDVDEGTAPVDAPVGPGGRPLPRTTIAYKRDRALEKLAVALGDNPEVVSYLTRGNTDVP